jgi:hypothetical protein
MVSPIKEIEPTMTHKRIIDGPPKDCISNTLKRLKKEFGYGENDD